MYGSGAIFFFSLLFGRQQCFKVATVPNLGFQNWQNEGKLASFLLSFLLCLQKCRTTVETNSRPTSSVGEGCVWFWFCCRLPKGMLGVAVVTSFCQNLKHQMRPSEIFRIKLTRAVKHYQGKFYGCLSSLLTLIGFMGFEGRFACATQLSLICHYFGSMLYSVGCQMEISMIKDVVVRGKF